jgi:hypothetical protein
MLLKGMFTVRNSRTGRKKLREREREEGKGDDNFTWKTLSR